ncbi:MAG: colanic acid/amylovoran biosynthesis glycosyltransferase [Paraglaciecola sp.]|jgi:colanic acid/amylovoran biosynthesis glycosyltransferase
MSEDWINKIKLLVVAPKFPLINQPWMDTYLEQLIFNEIKFLVFSLNLSPKNYHPKVDNLKLLNYTHAYSIDKSNIFAAVIKRFRIFASLTVFFRIRRKKLLNSLSNMKLLSYILHFYAIPESYDDIDIIHSHSEALSHRFIVLAEILNVPLVVTFHGLPPRGVQQLSAEKREELYRYVQKVIVNTNFAKKQVIAFGCSPEKIEVLPQGLPIENFLFNPAPVPGKGEPLRMLSVGRFHRDKGQHYSLLALKRLLIDGICAHWSFVGSGPDLAKLKELVHKLNIHDHVTFYENVSPEELSCLYSKCHIFVLASIDTPGGHVETQGVVLQEAQASGCLVIASRTGGIPECLSHKNDSILIKSQSSKAIYSAIKYFSFNSEDWGVYRQNGLLNVKQNFCSRVVGGKMAKLLEKGKRQ